MKFPFIFFWANMLLFLVWCTRKDNTPWDSPAASCPSVTAQGQSAGVKLERFAPILGAEFHTEHSPWAHSPSQDRTGPAGPSQESKFLP